MLIQKKETLNPGDVAAIKLVSGEEVIGRIVALESDKITLTKPVILQMQMVGPNDARLGFAPIMAGAPEDGNFTFEFRQCLILPMKARQDVSGGYLQATTGLVQAPAGGVIR